MSFVHKIKKKSQSEWLSAVDEVNGEGTAGLVEKLGWGTSVSSLMTYCNTVWKSLENYEVKDKEFRSSVVNSIWCKEKKICANEFTMSQKTQCEGYSVHGGVGWSEWKQYLVFGFPFFIHLSSYLKSSFSVFVLKAMLHIVFDNIHPCTSKDCLKRMLQVPCLLSVLFILTFL